MGLACTFGRHTPVTRGIRNEDNEFGRCIRCNCDLVHVGRRWKRVPKGLKVVWRPRTGDGLNDLSAGYATVGKEVDLKGVTVIGERRYGAQRFALVVLNANDEGSYTDATDILNAQTRFAPQTTSRVNGRK